MFKKITSPLVSPPHTRRAFTRRVAPTEPCRKEESPIGASECYRAPNPETALIFSVSPRFTASPTDSVTSKKKTKNAPSRTTPADLPLPPVPTQQTSQVSFQGCAPPSTLGASASQRKRETPGARPTNCHPTSRFESRTPPRSTYS